MKDKDFMAVSSFVREKEGAFLSVKTLERMLECETLGEVMDDLSKREKYPFTEEMSLQQADELLGHSLEETYSSVYDQLSHPIVLDILAARYEFDNIRIAFLHHQSFFARPPIYTSIGRVATEEYPAFFEHQDPFKSDLPDYLLKPAQRAIQQVAEGMSPTEAQEGFYQAMFAHMLGLSEEVNNDVIADLVGTFIDFHNILMMLNVKAEQRDPSALESKLVGGGKTSLSFFQTSLTRSLETAIPVIYHKEHHQDILKAVSFFEKKEDFAIFSHLLRHIQKKMVAKIALADYGPEVPFGYILRKENEIADIRTILYGKEEGRSAETLKAYLFIA